VERSRARERLDVDGWMSCRGLFRVHHPGSRFFWLVLPASCSGFRFLGRTSSGPGVAACLSREVVPHQLLYGLPRQWGRPSCLSCVTAATGGRAPSNGRGNGSFPQLQLRTTAARSQSLPCVPKPVCRRRKVCRVSVPPGRGRFRPGSSRGPRGRIVRCAIARGPRPAAGPGRRRTSSSGTGRRRS